MHNYTLVFAPPCISQVRNFTDKFFPLPFWAIIDIQHCVSLHSVTIWDMYTMRNDRHVSSHLCRLT